MLNAIKKKLIFLADTPLHPQWLANKFHKLKLNPIKLIKNQILLDVGSGALSLSNIIDSSNILITSDYPTTSKLYLNKPHVYLDAKSLPIASCSLDGIVCYEVLEHIDFSEQVLSEFSRVIKPNGSIYLSVPFLYPEHDVPYDFFRFSLHGLTTIFARHGFTIEHTLKIGEGIEGMFLLINLYLMLLVRKGEKKIGYFIFPIALVVMAACLFNNVMAIFLKKLLPTVTEFYLGVSIVAKKYS